MSEQQIEHLKKTVHRFYTNRKDAVWIEAFKIYNEANGKNMGMGCPPCFGKVLRYILAKQAQKQTI